MVSFVDIDLKARISSHWAIGTSSRITEYPSWFSLYTPVHSQCPGTLHSDSEASANEASERGVPDRGTSYIDTVAHFLGRAGPVNGPTSADGCTRLVPHRKPCNCVRMHSRRSGTCQDTWRVLGHRQARRLCALGRPRNVVLSREWAASPIGTLWYSAGADGGGGPMSPKLAWFSLLFHPEF